MIKPQMSFLDRPQCEQIHQAALEILRRTGVRVFHEEALRLLAEADCVVLEENRVFIPPSLVEWALRQPPSRVVLCRRGSNGIGAALQERTVNFGPGSDCPNFLDPRKSEHRPFTLADMRAVLQLADFLPELSFLMSTGIPSDYPGNAYRKQFATAIQNCQKPIVFVCDDGQDCGRIVAAAAAVAAEVLSGLVIHQLKRTGSPFVFGSGLHHLDMRTSMSVYGAPEFQLARLGIADLGRYYELPT